MADQDILEAFAPVEEPAAPTEEAAEEFPFNTLPPEITFTVRDVPPPSPSYISPDDRLCIEARNAISGILLEVHTRLLKPTGQIIQSLHTYTPTADRALNRWTIPLAEGFLLTATVDAPSLGKPGGCYVRALLLRGAAPVLPIGQVLLAGYVVTGSALVWPYPRYVHPCEGPGRLRLVVGTDPAAGNPILEYVPSGARWKLVALEVPFTTDATAVNRYMRLSLGDGGYSIYRQSPIVAQGASTALIYNWAIGIARATSVIGGYVQDALPDQLVLSAGAWISVYAYGMQPGDDFGFPQMYVEEWIEP